MHRTAAKLAIMMAVALAIQPAFAKSERLWTEKPSSAPKLANVPDFASLAGEAVPAVVSIQVEQKARVSRSSRRGGAPFPSPFDFFREFEPMPHGPSHGIGSGFVIRKDGLILTNNHVVENADKIEVSFLQPDGTSKTVPAKVLGTAPEYDVALLQTEKDVNAPAIALGDSDAMNIGDWVMAVGNPFGLSHSVSVGIISAKERRDIAPSGRTGLYDFIQTDASINPGNSGGPLVNMKGEVIGVNTAINAQGSGIGFAIPINMIKAMLNELKTKGHFSRSWIGIRIQPLTRELAQSYGLDAARGALVADVVENSPASKGGLREGDIILTFNGRDVRSSKDLQLLASMAGVGASAELKVLRDGKSRNMRVVLEAYPDEEVAAVRPGEQAEGELGMTVANITPELQQYFRLSENQGVVLKEVTPGSPAGRAGLRPGDVVESLNGKVVKDARSFAAAVRAVKSGQAFRLKVKRDSMPIFVGLVKP